MPGNFLVLNVFNFLSISPLLIVIFVSIIFILIYLYKTSEVMNKKFLASMACIILIAFTVINIFIFLNNRPQKVAFRLTFCPLQIESKNSLRHWEGKAFWHVLTQQLQNAVAEKAVILPANWITKIVNSDSAYNPKYLSRLNRKLGANYLLIGLLSSNNGVSRIKYQMMLSENNKIVLDDSIDIIPEELSIISWKAATKILQYFNFSPTKNNVTIRMINSNGYEKYLAGWRLYQREDYENALKYSKQAIAKDSSILEAYLLAGKSNFMIALNQKRKGKSAVEFFQQSRDWLNKTIARDSLNGEAFVFLGEYFIYQERWSLAEKCLIKAYQLSPQNPRLYLTMSRLHDFRYKKLGFKNEEQLFKKAIFVNPCYEDAYLMLSDFYLFENKRKRAIEVLEQILDINPNSVPVLMALGKIYLVRNDILKIIEVFNRVIKLDPKNADAFYNLGILYYNSKDYVNAEKFLKRAVAINNHLNSHLYLAYLYELKGEKEKAIEHLRDRIRYRKGLDDEFAEQARKRLFDLMHGDSVKVLNQL